MTLCPRDWPGARLMASASVSGIIRLNNQAQLIQRATSAFAIRKSDAELRGQRNHEPRRQADLKRNPAVIEENFRVHHVMGEHRTPYSKNGHKIGCYYLQNSANGPKI